MGEYLQQNKGKRERDDEEEKWKPSVMLLLY